MIVKHNLSAMNANRRLGITTRKQTKSSEKLSSGHKINRAADDAAGLSISEKMRKQIRGLDRASTNAEDGISCVQTAEGALGEVHDMLHRMNELAVQAANGTNSESDRSALQAEIDELTREIDRVAETTKFNETSLLKGAGSEGKYRVLNTAINPVDNAGLGSLTAQAPVFTDYATGKASELTAASTTKYGADATQIITVADQTYDLKNYSDLDELAGAISNNPKVSSVDLTYKGGAEPSVKTPTPVIFELTEVKSTTTVSGDVTFKVSSAYTGSTTQASIEISADPIMTITFDLATKLDDEGKLGFDEETTISSIKAGLKTAGYSFTESNGVFSVKTNATMSINATSMVEDTNFNLHVGADGNELNKVNVNLSAMDADSLGISGLNVMSERNATAALDVISEAILTVSEQRSALGAIQNRLESSIRNLDNIVENTTSAESRLRDTDMAEEMVAYSNLNILAQAGQSMLTQANQSSQGVITLLQG